MYVRVVRAGGVIVIVVAVRSAGMRVGGLGAMAVRWRRRLVPLILVLAHRTAQVVVASCRTQANRTFSIIP